MGNTDFFIPQSGRHLAFTVALDPPGSPGHRSMARMLVSSLVRTHFDGDVVIFHNWEEPIFRVLRHGVHEIRVKAPEIHGLPGAEEAWCWKYRVRAWLEAAAYDKVLFLDADCLALRNLDHLLEGEWDIAFQPETGLSITLPQFSCFLTDEERRTLKRNGVNSGTLAVRGSQFSEIMEEWERIDSGEPKQPRHCSDQGSWNRLLLDHTTRTSLTTSPRWKAVPFQRGEVQFPMYLHPQFNLYKDAALVHCLGGDTRVKLQFMFGLYMSTFFWDEASTISSLLDM